MTTPSSSPPLHQSLITITAGALAELDPLWSFSPKDLTQALFDVVPSVVQKWNVAAASAAADWYDNLRETDAIPGRFSAIVPDLGDQGSQALAGWGAEALKAPQVPPDAAPSELPVQNLDPVESAQYRVEGGVQKRLVNAANLTVTASSKADPKARGWMRRTRPEACGFCRMVASRGAIYTKSSATFACHEHCFPAGVLVTGPTTEVGYRRAYQGELVVIRFANGQELPVTPNHPVLTHRGWVPAGQLNVGEDVFERSGTDLASLDVPHEDDVPACIEDVWGANSMDRLRSVPVTSEDFHGDMGFRESYVDVVATHRFLANVRNAALVQPLAEIVRSGAGAASVLSSLTTLSSDFEPTFGQFHGPEFFVGRSGACPSHRWILPLLTQGLSFAHGADVKARFLEPAVDYGAGNSVRSGQGVDALASLITLQDVGSGIDPVMAGGVIPGWSSLNAVAGESVTNSIAGLPSEDGSDLIKRLAGGIKPLRIVDLRSREFSGHVYNLQTAEGWYSANGVIVHNCYCEAVPAWGGKALPVGPYKPSDRPMNAADRARVRKWIANNL